MVPASTEQAGALRRAWLVAERSHRLRAASGPARQRAHRLPTLAALALVVMGGLMLSAVAPAMGSVRDRDIPAHRPETLATAEEMVAYRCFHELFGEGNLAVAGELLAPDVRLHSPNGGGERPEAITSLVTLFRTAFSDVGFPIADIAVAGNQVTVRWTMIGTHAGTYGDIPATGNRVTMDGIAMLHVERGRIVEVWMQYDRLGLIAQLLVRPVFSPEIAAPVW